VNDVRVCAGVADLAYRAAEAAATIIKEAVETTGRCSLVLSGGDTPRDLYSRWASRFADEVPWAGVHVFWGDERFVPVEDRHSNYKMAKEALLDHVPIPAANVHAMVTSLDSPELAATAYEALLRRDFDGNRPRFDLLLLGLGPEGHTASLFPRSPALDETARWVLPVTVPADPPSRLTLTLPALTGAMHTYVLVTGSEKAAALAHVLSEKADVQTYPAAGIRTAGGDGPVWWVDREAAASYRPRS
jgi:6-phosphogluconolactonase